MKSQPSKIINLIDYCKARPIMTVVSTLLFSSAMVALSNPFAEIEVVGSNDGDGFINVQTSGAVANTYLHDDREAAIAVGEGNKVETQSIAVGKINRPGKQSIAVGYKCVGINDSRNCLTVGSSVTASGGRNAAGFGANSHVQGANAFAFGYYNTVKSHLGTKHKVNAASDSYAAQYGLQQAFSTTFVAGKALHVEHEEACTAVGMFNDDAGEPSTKGHAFLVGTGEDYDNRKNSMEVYHDGRVIIGNPNEEAPLVTLRGDVILEKEQGDISMGSYN